MRNILSPYCILTNDPYGTQQTENYP